MSRRGVADGTGQDYTADPGKMPLVPPSPLPAPQRHRRTAPRRHRSRAGQRHRRARHGQGRHRLADGRGGRHHRPHHRRLPAAGPDPARRPRPGRVAARRDPREARLDRAHRRREGRGHGQGPLERQGERARHDDPGHHPGHHHRLGQGRRRQVVGHRQPGRRAGRHRVHRRRARRRHLGLLDPPHARRRGPARGLEDRREEDRPQHQGRSAPAGSRSCRWACSSTTRSRP